jgi:hypothetical protein
MNCDQPGTKTAGNREKPQADVLGAIVQCNGFRCWAKKNQNSEWIDWQGNKLNVIDVVTVFR